MPDPQTHELRTDVRGLIRLLAKNLYAQPDVFIREMLQNAHDAIRRRRDDEGNAAPAGEIHIEVHRTEATLVFEDNGAGLTEEEVHEYLSTIGRSGTDAFRQQLLEKGRHAEADNLIGQFGIGLLSAFVVAARVTVETRSSQPGNPGWRWECWGDKAYTLAALPADALAPGRSRVTLHVDDAHRDALDLETLRAAVRKYADFLSVPILLNAEGRINTVDAPWHRAYATENEQLTEYSLFVARRFPDSPLSVIPLDLTDPVPAKGVLYISDRRRSDMAAPGRVDVYQARMFIVSDQPDLLPPWAKFVRGVVDSPALTPTAARDNVIQDGNFRALRDALGRVIIDHLKDLARRDQRRFLEIMDWHHYHIKGMALEADDFFQEVADLLPFETNEGPLALGEYLTRTVKAGDGRPHLLYFSERGQATQFFMLANARGILVINASYIYETEFLQKYARQRPNVKLEQLDFTASDLIFQPLPPEEADAYRNLIFEFNAIMPTAGSAAKMVRFRPTNIPAVLTLTESQKLQRQMRSLKDNPILPSEIRDLLGRVIDERPVLPVTIHLNADNPTIQALAKLPLRSEVARQAMLAIYNNALMLAQHLITPENAEIMFRQANEVIKLLIEQTQEAAQARQEATRWQSELRAAAQTHTAARTPHVSCFVAFDFEQRDALFAALCDVLQDRPYYWQVVRADQSVGHPDLLPNLTDKMRRAHCFIADLSEANANVLLELGMMLTLDRPCMLLRAKDRPAELAANLGGKLYVEYDAWDNPDSLRAALAEALERDDRFQTLIDPARPRYLSPVLLRTSGVTRDYQEALCREYTTVEDFLQADPAQAARRIACRPSVIQTLREHLQDYCQMT